MILEQCKGVYCVDLCESFQVSIAENEPCKGGSPSGTRTREGGGLHARLLRRQGDRQGRRGAGHGGSLTLPL